MEWNWESRNKQLYLITTCTDNWCLTRVPKKFDGERIAASTTLAGTSGYSHAKE